MVNQIVVFFFSGGTASWVSIVIYIPLHTQNTSGLPSREPTIGAERERCWVDPHDGPSSDKTLQRYSHSRDTFHQFPRHLQRLAPTPLAASVALSAPAGNFITPGFPEREACVNSSKGGLGKTELDACNGGGRPRNALPAFPLRKIFRNMNRGFPRIGSLNFLSCRTSSSRFHVLEV